MTEPGGFEQDGAALVDALNLTVLAVHGVSELFPPRSVAHSAADQLAAAIRGDEAPKLRTVLIEEYDGGVKVTARIGVEVAAKTPEVVTAVASAIRTFMASEIDEKVHCVASVQAVSIQ
ncbi:phage tail sheath gpL-like [Psychromicrobium silvestre]|uniref:Phage tail sheath gpL-like n=1 Tax=Psychromicrobium silvestre TaxID=1645614 RepID=A0A7Y9LVF6_9MICC|nr:hypothetical protein [Psychromicrobium silvestre]NYE96316.1 phage tail sheath gpL-like [Psychromicrobium silvestre]